MVSFFAKKANTRAHFWEGVTESVKQWLLSAGFCQKASTAACALLGIWVSAI